MTQSKRIVRAVISAAMVICFATAGALAQNNQQNGQISQQIDPTRPSFPARAMLLSNDPFAQINFDMCVQANSVNVSGVDQKTTQMFTTGQTIFDLFKGNTQNKNANDLLSCNRDLEAEFPNSCTMFTGKKKKRSKNGDDEFGVYDPKKQDEIAKNIKALYDCKVNQTLAAQAAASCFQTQFDLLKTAMNEVQKDFAESQSSMQNYVNDLDGKIEAQGARVTSLEGKEKTFQDTRKEIESVLAEVNGNAGRKDQGEVHNIAQLKNLYTDVDRMHKDFEQFKASYRYSQASNCLHKTKPKTSVIGQCAFDNTYECVLNFYRDQLVPQNANNKDRQKADEKRKIFASDIALLEGELAGTTEPDQIPNVIAKYESTLLKYGTAGKLFLTDLKTCDAAAKNKIIDEVNSGTGEAGSRKTALDKLAVSVNSEASNIIDKLDTAIRDASKAMLGQEVNELLDGNGCSTKVVKGPGGVVQFEAQSLKIQLECAQGLNENLKAMLKGTKPPGSNYVLKVPVGKDDKGTDVFCQGLRDCEKKAGDLKSAASARKASMEGNGTYEDARCKNNQCPGKKKFTKEANKNIESTFAQAADLFKNRVGQAKAQLEKLKQLFQKAGITFPSMSDEKPHAFKCKGENDLCELPDPFDDALAGAAGLPNMKSKDFENVLKDAKDKKDQLDKQYQGLVQKLPDKAKECKKQLGEDETQRLSKYRNDIQSLIAECESAAGAAKTEEDKPDTSGLDEIVRSISSVCKDMASTQARDECERLQREARTGKNRCNTLFSKTLTDYEDRKNNQLIQQQMIQNMTGGSKPVEK